ncbi:hypothetical protein BCR43DRAFT_471887 [Syncephalastrum racemosum]|uniref:Uncharacterized protein n=1 Tax=Syncephalastrum racemosum TaxID=13706 RepID=A0A1X2HJL0_SYNRA|nr:hypothetical protein BCR43DRAFT_471887 [Syncephalastrum racemosum]
MTEQSRIDSIIVVDVVWARGSIRKAAKRLPKSEYRKSVVRYGVEWSCMTSAFGCDRKSGEICLIALTQSGGSLGCCCCFVAAIEIHVYPHFHTLRQSLMSDDSYARMLNNPSINPPPAAAQASNTMQDPALPQGNLSTATPFPELDALQKQMTQHTEDLVLVSETDAPLEWISADWDQKPWPPACEDLKGWVQDTTPCKTQSLQDFFGPLTDASRDPYEQSQGFKAVQETFGKADDTRVFLCGERSIVVLILGVLTSGPRRALFGLRSLLVRT